MRILRLILIAVLLAANAYADAQKIRIAVASNFLQTLDNLKSVFLESHSDAEIHLIPGSTGKLYAQLKAGAPYDIFFAADALRPRLLEKEKIVQKGNRFTYAHGVLVLWSRDEKLKPLRGANILRIAAFRKLAIANPELAPYGKASIEMLGTLGAIDSVKDKLVYGENISHAFHFAKSGAADFALISYAHIANNKSIGGCYWLPPISSYMPIEQQAVLLSSNELAIQFFDFCKSAKASATIRSSGYRIP